MTVNNTANIAGVSRSFVLVTLDSPPPHTLSSRVMQELHFAEWEFSIYFVGYCKEADIPSDPKERTRWVFQQVRSVLSAALVDLNHP